MIAFDTETALIRPGCLAPPLTCVSWAEGPSGRVSLFDHREGPEVFEDNLFFSDKFVGHNVSYDLAVLCTEKPSLLPLVFAALEADRITDTRIRQKLIDIAQGQHKGYRDGATEQWVEHLYSLDALAQRHLDKKLDKHTWRLRYGELRGVPIEQWEEGARHYAEEDALTTLQVWQHQEKWLHLLADQYRQTRAAWWLHLISCWGIRTEEAAVQALELSVSRKLSAATALCRQHSLVRENGSRDTKKARRLMLQACEALGIKPKRTKTYTELKRADTLTEKQEAKFSDPLFGVSLDEEACTTVKDPVLEAYSQVSSLKIIADTHIPALYNGVRGPIQPSFDSLIATGRTSCKGYSEGAPTNGYQLQNVRRLPGIRECFVPRKGRLFLSADYDGLELRTFAQVCMWVVGWSRLGEALNSGKDPHSMLGASLLELSYEDMLQALKNKEPEAKDARQFSKVGNFGFQGGMGAESFRAHAREQFKIYKSHEECEHLHEMWKVQWAEQAEYFRWINSQCDPLADVKHFGSDRHRGSIRYTVACNTFFQGLAADATKHAGFAIAKECWAGEDSPLYGCRVVNYVHDEFILECPDSLPEARAAARRLVEVMCERAGEWLPDVPPTASPVLMTRWSKDADPTFDSNRELVPWSP